MSQLIAQTDTVKRILEQVNDLQLYEIMVALIHRHKVLYPDWDLLFLSLPVDPTLREKEIQNALPLLRTTAPANKKVPR